jgi:hypothetical protein
MGESLRFHRFFLSMLDLFDLYTIPLPYRYLNVAHRFKEMDAVIKRPIAF